MKSDKPEERLETLAEAAQRLLAKLDERKGRPPAEKAGEIQANVIKFPDRRGGRSADNLVPQYRAPAFTQVRRW